MNQRRGQSPGGRTEYVSCYELGCEVRFEMALETVWSKWCNDVIITAQVFYGLLKGRGAPSINAKQC